MLGLSDWEFKSTMIKMLKDSSGWSWQHARPDGQCKQKDGSPRKAPKINARGKWYNSRQEYLW